MSSRLHVSMLMKQVQIINHAFFFDNFFLEHYKKTQTAGCACKLAVLQSLRGRYLKQDHMDASLHESRLLRHQNSRLEVDQSKQGRHDYVVTVCGRPTIQPPLQRAAEERPPPAKCWLLQSRLFFLYTEISLSLPPVLAHLAELLEVIPTANLISFQSCCKEAT